MVTDANGRAHRAQGSPASSGGQFDTQATPDAAVTLDADDHVDRVLDGILMLTDDVAAAEHAVEVANRRLDRAGITERFILTVEEQPTQVDGVWYETSLVALSRPRIGQGDWHFAGVHDLTPSGEYVSHLRDAAANRVIPEGTVCDHCGKTRHRTRMFTITNDHTGETKQVGAACVQAFLGLRPEGLWSLEFGFEESRFHGGHGGGGALHAGEDVLLAALRASNGGDDWVSQVDANWKGRPSTVQLVRESLAAHREPATSDEAGQLAEVLAWVDAIPDDTDSDFLRNVRQSLRPAPDGSVVVRSKHVGLAAAAVVGYRTQQRQAARKAADAAVEASIVQQHVGEPGAKIVGHGRVKVLKVTGYDTDYGWVSIATFQDAQGRLLKWKSQSLPDFVDEGAELDLERATVKAHEEWRGNAETAIIRAKLTLPDPSDHGGATTSRSEP